MTLQISFHGGHCCGIKTIKGFPYYKPGISFHDQEPALQKTEAKNNDAHGTAFKSDSNFFTDEAPRESVEERFGRYIAFLKKRRPQGCVEVALARTAYGGWDQNKLWWPLLKKHGFKKTVPEFLNSNSSNYVTIYHLVYDELKKKKAETTAVPDPFLRSS